MLRICAILGLQNPKAQGMLIMNLLIYLLVLCVLCVIVVIFYTKPSKNLNQERITHSPHFRDGRFHNFEPIIVQEWKFWTLLEVFSNKGKPKSAVASIKNDLKSLPKEQELLVWFGHSSFLLQTSHKRFLVDLCFKPTRLLHFWCSLLREVMFMI